MRIYSYFVLHFFLALSIPVSCFAQDIPLVANTTGENEKSQIVQAVVTGPTDVAVGRTIILDGSSSGVPSDDVKYLWFLEPTPAPISRSVEAVYTPEEAGSLTFRLEVRTEVDGETIESAAMHKVTVFERKITLIADTSVSQEKLSLHIQSAEDAGVFLRVLQPGATGVPLGQDEALSTLLSDQWEAVSGAQAIVLWTDGISGLQALMRAVKGEPERLASLKNRTLILITSRGLGTLTRTARGPFSVLQPQKIIVTRKEAINPLLSVENMDQFVTEISQRDIDFLVIDKEALGLRPWNLLSSFVNYMLTHGISSQTVILLLMLPVIATILAFLKQVIGITTFGLYTPSIVALSFLALGWWVGVLFLISIIAAGYATRAVMRKWRLLYIPKVAIILTVVSLSLLILIGIGASLGLVLSSDTIFVLLIMSTLAESFLNLKTEEGLFSAVLAIGETIVAAILCVFIVKWPPLQSFILAYPELILTTILFNFFLGRWTGLRLVEYFRFHEVLKSLQEEE